MAPQPSKHGRCTRQLVFFLLLVTLLLSTSTAALAVAAVVPTSYSSHCSSPSPAAPDNRHASVVSNDDAELLISSFHLRQPSTGFFSVGRGANSLFFSPNSSDGGGLHLHGRSLSFVPHNVSRTADDPTLLHLTATLTLFVYRRDNDHSSSAISFNLDGYYSSASSELCMVGTGTTGADDDDVLMTVHFASFGEPQGFGHGKGRISSLRDSTDDLYFETRDIAFFGMGEGNQQQQQQQVSASIWRRMASMMLFCVFTVLIWRRLQATRRRNHEEAPPPAMSMAMHVVIISLVCVALDFILSHWVFLLVTFVHMFS